MASFNEDQRIVIRSIATDEAERQIKESPIAKSRIEAVVVEKLPRVHKLEKLLSSWYGIVGIVVAVPLASAGAAAALQALLDKGVQQLVKTEIESENGPVKKHLSVFSKFRGNLSAQFEKSVDSATSKLLRFGCNPPGGVAADGFPSCVQARTADTASVQARNVQEVNDQTIIFKANDNQRVLLRLRLSPVDEASVLARVGLRLQMPPLLAVGGGTQHNIKVEAKDLPDTHDFVMPESGLLRLYGPVFDKSDREPLHVDMDLTRHLRRDADVHAIRFRSEPLPGGGRPASAGSERFYFHAIVIVTHNLPKD